MRIYIVGAPGVGKTFISDHIVAKLPATITCTRVQTLHHINNNPDETCSELVYNTPPNCLYICESRVWNSAEAEMSDIKLKVECPLEEILARFDKTKWAWLITQWQDYNHSTHTADIIIPNKGNQTIVVTMICEYIMMNMKS